MTRLLNLLLRERGASAIERRAPRPRLVRSEMTISLARRR